MKKRSCRRTKDESWYHDKAVRLRKMTDEQLVNYVEDRVEKARSEGYNEGRQKAAPEGTSAAEFIADLQANKVPGIGIGTINKLMKVAIDHGYIQ